MAQRWFIFQTENLKYLKSTNFLGFRTTENEIYVKFCLRKSLVARDSIVDILGIKAGRFLRVFSKEAPGKLKNTNSCFSRYLPTEFQNQGRGGTQTPRAHAVLVAVGLKA